MGGKTHPPRFLGASVTSEMSFDVFHLSYFVESEFYNPS